MVYMPDTYPRILLHIRSGDFDIIHNNTVHYLPTLLSFLNRVPLVTTLHTPPYRGQLLGARVARLFARAHFIAISELIARQWKRTVPNSHLIYNGLDITKLPPPGPVTPRSAVWVGRISPEKGVTHAIRAARKAGYPLRLIGPVYNPAYYAQEVRPLLGEDAVYLGPLSHSDLLRQIASASVALFTSLWEEPFGLVLLEYLGCGTPVAAYTSGAAREILNEQVSALAPVGDIERLSRCITEASTCDRAHCRAYVSQRFPLDRMVEAYAAYYRTLLPR
jgi:glycosyltransferase involved in cell wall biosynthesis